MPAPTPAAPTDRQVHGWEARETVRATSRRTLRRVAPVLAAGAALTGCSSSVEVPVAPYADDPVCARVILALPDVLAGADRVSTTSQGTAAWTAGEPGDAITLRCGVEPLPPTTEQCVTVADDRGRSVDWVAVPGDESTRTPWRFTTYGRLPAVEVVVPSSVPPDRAQSLLVDLGEAASHAKQSRACL
ncbi:DUF3515 family protein [uncultured Cellulomonas sp.]|uniref:DUF3515 family protein n=1 Tax=uncultured Cellulomonas sp. TaxID=189682 RepID=UPI00261C9771|nr:DUF3515 family protein [uncultured Cellulomonas sp.]